MAGVFLPFAAALFIPALYRFLTDDIAYVGGLVAATSFLLILSQYGRQGAVTFRWVPSLGIRFQFHVDGLSLLMGVLVTGIGVCIFAYSRGYMENASSLPRYYMVLLLFMGSMLGVVFAADLVLLFIFWELTSIASFLLISHDTRNRSSLYAARKSMVTTIGGSLFMMAGFLFIYTATGTFSLVDLLAHPAAMQQSLRNAGLFIPVLLLIAVGAAAKSAQVPLHIWLPNAMEAPTPVSAFLHSATMVKAGVYLIGRFRPLLAGPEWMLLFTALGLTTMIVAGILAVNASDIKGLLAYSTASHLGLITAGFGFVSGMGGEAGVFHILNHALFKAPLFLVAGIVAHAAGTRAIDDLDGIRHQMPITAAVAVVAGLGMAAFPPFNGFYSKEILFEAAYDAAVHGGGLYWLLPAAAVFGSIFTVLYSLRFILLFFGSQTDAVATAHAPSRTMLIPPVLLAAASLFVGILPQETVNTVVQAAFNVVVAGHAHTIHVGLPTRLTPAFGMSLATMVGGVALYRYRAVLQTGLDTLFVAFPYLQANRWYDTAVSGVQIFSGTLADRIHTGLLRTYVAWIMAAISCMVLVGYLATGVTLPAASVDTALPIILILGVALTGAFAVTVAPSHISGVLTLSVLGLTVAIFYILANAPDLALTQLVVETLALVIFLLVVDRIPASYIERSWPRVARDVLLSALAGVTVAVTVLVTTAGTPDRIARYFVEHAVSAGGGGNIVNVILVDFRGFDTMGEIAVIAMAAISVVTLIAMRGHGTDHGRDTHRSTGSRTGRREAGGGRP
jgi:multicomponent Na+:H+ antiporter subunit A